MPKNRHPNFMPRPKAKPQEGNPRRKTVPVIRTVPEYIPLVFSDALMIQAKDGMFIMSFLQTQYPLAATVEELEHLNKVEQRCLAQIIVTPHQMAKNLAVLNKNFEDFLEQQDEETQKYLKDLMVQQIEKSQK
jgi:hypothetical protein